MVREAGRRGLEERITTSEKSLQLARAATEASAVQVRKLSVKCDGMEATNEVLQGRVAQLTHAASEENLRIEEVCREERVHMECAITAAETQAEAAQSHNRFLTQRARVAGLGLMRAAQSRRRRQSLLQQVSLWKAGVVEAVRSHLRYAEGRVGLLGEDVRALREGSDTLRGAATGAKQALIELAEEHQVNEVTLPLLTV